MFLNARHTGIVVRDLNRAIDFYRSFGFEQVGRERETGHFIDQVTGIPCVELEWSKLKLSDGFVLELLQYHSHSQDTIVQNAASNALGCSHIAFTVESIEQACEMVLEKGGTIVNPAAESPCGRVMVAYCHDPEGVLIEVVEVN